MVAAAGMFWWALIAKGVFSGEQPRLCWLSSPV
jgi:hypothetical protein